MGEGGEFDSGNDYTEVYWNMDDYPIPVGIDDLGSIGINIVDALDRFGFDGYKDISVHCKRLECDVMDKLDKARICYLPACTRIYLASADVNKVTTTLDMTAFMLQSALVTDPMNIAVIAKPTKELVRVLRCLKSRGHTPLLIDPPDDEECVFSVESLLRYAHLISLNKEEEEDHPSQGQEDTSKILDFLELVTPTLKGPITPVFWDAVDCPFPLSSTPDEIYHSIASHLLKWGLQNITIWAYLDDDDKKGGSWRDALRGDKKKTWASRIYFFPAGDKASRRIRMTNDILFWAKESAKESVPFQESLFLVSDQFRGDPHYVDLIHHLVSSGLHVFFVTPTPDINKPESPEWPGLLIEEGTYQLLFERSQPRPKKRKADAGVLFMLEAEEETSGIVSGNLGQQNC